MTSAARSLSSAFAYASPAARTIHVAIAAVVGAAVAAAAGWRASTAFHHRVVDDHTLRDLGIHRLDLA